MKWKGLMLVDWFLSYQSLDGGDSMVWCSLASVSRDKRMSPKHLSFKRRSVIG